MGRAIAGSLGPGGRRRTGMPVGHGSAVNEDRFAKLVDLCDEHGIRIEWADLGTKRHGQYRRSRRLIELNHRLTLRQLVPGLAHEFAHYVYDDGCSTTASERRAWEYAAQMLVSAPEVARVESIVGSHPNAIAAELDLTPVIVEAFRRVHRAAVDRGDYSVGGDVVVGA